jgi:protein gp37
MEITVATSDIEWTEATWNPLAGCAIVSPGCTNCYAMRRAVRLQAMGMAKYAGTTRKSGKRHVWTGRVNVDKTALTAPLSWKKPQRIFVNSMSDLF